MNRRLELHKIFVNILGTQDLPVSRVYFQPPESIKLKYPCIIYKRNNIWTRYANNLPYTQKPQYQVTVVDSDSDSSIAPKVAALPLTSYDRSYTANNLHHDVFTIFY